MLLNEIGVFVESESILKTSDVSGKFSQDFIENIATISAGITKLQVLQETWNGEIFWMKAAITIDKKSLEESLKQLVNDRQKVKELEDLKQQLNVATKELERLKKELTSESKTNNPASGKLNSQKYNTEINTLIATDYILKGKEKVEKKDFTGAEIDYARAIDLDPHSASAFQGRGISRQSLNKHPEAIVDFTKAIELDPKNWLYFSLRGISKQSINNHEGALEDFTKAIAIDPEHWLPYAYRGISEQSVKDFYGAISDFTKAIELEPKDHFAYFNRGIVKGVLGDEEGGCIDLRKARELGHPNAHKAIRDLCN